MNNNAPLPLPTLRELYFRSTGMLDAPQAPRELTPSAKYVAQEARKRLGEQALVTQELRPSERELFQLIQAIETHEGDELSERERTAVVAALSSSLENYDVLTPLIENESVNDIIVRSYHDITVQIGRKNIETGLRFTDHESYKSFIENLLKRVGKSCTTATPVVDAALAPHIRACVTHESFSPRGSGPMLTIRIARHHNISLHGLAAFEFAPLLVLDYLRALVCSGQITLLIAGEVGTGKTTLVRALASQIPEEEAILIIEDTEEVVLDRRFVRTLLTREANTEGAGRITPAQAIRTGMRMAMNRIILGEMRDAETAEAFIDVCASGHAGMSTIHARSARDALSRLELFLARAQGNIGVEALRRQIANAVSVVVFVGMDSRSGRRRILEVVEVGSSADGVVQISPIFLFDRESELPQWTRGAGVTQFSEILRRDSCALPMPQTVVPLAAETLYRSLQE